MKTILIDAGHGGNNPGAVAASGQPESRTNLNVAMFLKDELEKSGLYRVVMVRNSHEIDVPLEVRMSIVSRLRPDFAVSIHHNSSVRQLANGSMCCVQVNENMRAGKASHKFAEFVSPYFRDLGFRDCGKYCRQQKDGRDYYGFLRAAAAVGVPAVITECGFLSNSMDLSKLDTYTEQKAEAVAIYKAIVKLDGEKYL